MLKPNQISVLVRETLRRMDVPEPSIAKLIRGTFAIESNLEILFTSRLYGLALMSDVEAQAMHKEILKFNRSFRDRIKRATNVDMESLGYKDFTFLLSSNIAFMVAVLYVYYSVTYKEIPQDNIDDIARTYAKFYAKSDDPTMIEEFKTSYDKHFL